jgi:hypothetical protein
MTSLALPRAASVLDLIHFVPRPTADAIHCRHRSQGFAARVGLVPVASMVTWPVSAQRAATGLTTGANYGSNARLQIWVLLIKISL